MRLMVTEVLVANQFEAYTYTGDDGYPTSKVFSPLAVTLADGRQFFLPQGVQKTDPEDGFTYYGYRYHDGEKADMMDGIRRLGINPDLWVFVEPQPSLEEQFAEMAEIEDQERRGLRYYG